MRAWNVILQLVDRYGEGLKWTIVKTVKDKERALAFSRAGEGEGTLLVLGLIVADPSAGNHPACRLVSGQSSHNWPGRGSSRSVTRLNRVESRCGRIDRSACVTTIIVMTPNQPFSLIYDPEVANHLQSIERKHHSLICNAIQNNCCSSRRAKHGTASRCSPAAIRCDLGASVWAGNRFRVLSSWTRNGRRCRYWR